MLSSEIISFFDGKEDLTKVFFRLLSERGTAYGLYRENILLATKKDLEKKERWEKTIKEASTKKKGKGWWYSKPGRPPEKPHNRNVQAYQQKIKALFKAGLLNDLGIIKEGRREKHYYKANPEVIHVFLEEALLCEDDFKLSKQLLREYLKSDECKNNVRKNLSGCGKTTIYDSYGIATASEFRSALKRLVLLPLMGRIIGYFEEIGGDAGDVFFSERWAYSLLDRSLDSPISDVKEGLYGTKVLDFFLLKIFQLGGIEDNEVKEKKKSRLLDSLYSLFQPKQDMLKDMIEDIDGSMRKPRLIDFFINLREYGGGIVMDRTDIVYMKLFNRNVSFDPEKLEGIISYVDSVDNHVIKRCFRTWTEDHKNRNKVVEDESSNAWLRRIAWRFIEKYERDMGARFALLYYSLRYDLRGEFMEEFKTVLDHHIDFIRYLDEKGVCVEVKVASVDPETRENTDEVVNMLTDLEEVRRSLPSSDIKG